MNATRIKAIKGQALAALTRNGVHGGWSSDSSAATILITDSPAARNHLNAAGVKYAAASGQLFVSGVKTLERLARTTSETND